STLPITSRSSMNSAREPIRKQTGDDVFLRLGVQSLCSWNSCARSSRGIPFSVASDTRDKVDGEPDITLGQLTRLELDEPTDYPPEIVRSLLKACPALEALIITGKKTARFAYPTLIDSVTQYCPRLKEFSFGNADTRATHQDWIPRIMNAVQENNLEIIRLNEFRTVRALLGTCAKLERLEVEQKQHSHLNMDLGHFVRSDWVCPRSTCLKLVVEYSRFQNESYFQGNCKVSRSDRNKWQS
ncbi:hypothetical protein BGX23_000344, partial [Mortierella sp. AD031]